MYYFKVLANENSDKLTYRDNGLVAATSMEGAITLVKEYMGGEDAIIEISITPVENILSGWEVEDIIDKNYYKERPWNDSEMLTL